MALLQDRVQETTTTTGTGTVSLGGAVTGYVTFNSVFSNGNIVWYCIDDGLGNWEIGTGTIGTGTLTRSVFQSSNAGALVSFNVGAKRVFCTAPYTYFLPDQTSNSGKVLTTDATTPSWTSSLNGITIGTTTAAAGAFTSLTVNGDTILGDAAVDTVTLNAQTVTLNNSTTISSASTKTITITSAATGAIDGFNIGGTTAGTGAFTTLNASSASVISVSSASDALRITQTGAGNALVVEDSANPDSTPFVVDTFGKVLIGNTVATGSYAFGTNAQLQMQNAYSVFSQYSASSSGNVLDFVKSRSNTIGTQSVVVTGDVLGGFYASGSDGTAFIPAAQILAVVDGTPGTNDMPGRLVFSTTADGASSPTERMRIDNAGRVGIGAAAAASMSLRVAKQITGSTFAYGIAQDTTIQSDVTNTASLNLTLISTQAAAFTLSNLRHYSAAQGTVGAGSTVTNQYGYFADPSLIGATNNYGFYSNIASGTGRYNFYANGTADNYFAGSLGIGAPPIANANLYIVKNITGGVNAFGIAHTATIQSDVTTNAYGSNVSCTTAVASFTLSNLFLNRSTFGGLGAGSAVTNLYGFYAESTIVGATNNYGFYSNIASGTGRYNFYAAGTADNYFAGNTQIQGNFGLGIPPDTGIGAFQYRSALTGVDAYGSSNILVAASTNTSSIRGFQTYVGTAAAAFTLSHLYHYDAAQGTIGAGSTVTSQYGFRAESTLTGATNNYGFFSNIASGTGRYNFYAAGTAANYFAGKIGIGTGAPFADTSGISFGNNLTGGTTQNVHNIYATISSDVTATARGYNSQLQTTAAAFTLNSIHHFNAAQIAIGAGSTVNNQMGFRAESTLTGATNNYGFYSNIASGTGRYNFYAAGTAQNVFAGDVLINSTGGLGYTTGSGGAVTQATSRTTGVTLNKTNGAITLVSAAGLPTYQTFTVTNSTVAATDVILVSQKSGTDKYIILVTAVAAGSFAITYATTGGTTTEQPVFNFAVLKAVAA